jgi:hypothetical protein
MNPILILGPCLLVIAFFLVVRAIRDGSDSEERFPPISDEEFLARCSPGTDPEIALKVRRIIADSLGIEYERIHPSMRFVEDIGTD